jgi:DNA polymerase/3'-5' exonuclease PolX
MANENEEEVVEELPEVIEGEEDTTDYKALALKMQGMAKRFQTKLSKLAEAPKPKAEVVPEKKEDGLDRIDRAVLRAEKITDPEEVDLVQSIMKETGKDLDKVLESKYFQSELKEMRDTKASKEAIPSGTKRSSQSARDTVDYWVSKGELPPTDQVELRRKVVNARMQTEKSKSQFTDQPIV